jgi:arylsulfatase A-like enzyme
MTGKTTLWERSTRVPLIFSGPGVLPLGRCTRPAELLDIYPTLIELAGLPKKDGLEGQSLVPQLQDSAAERARPAITTHGPNNHAIRSEQWRYIRYADGSEELYDLDEDPNEWTNRAGEPGREPIKRELAKWLPKVNASPAPGSKTRLIEVREDGQVYWEGKLIPPDAQPQ